MFLLVSFLPSHMIGLQEYAGLFCCFGLPLMPFFLQHRRLSKIHFSTLSVNSTGLVLNYLVLNPWLKADGAFLVTATAKLTSTFGMFLFSYQMLCKSL